MTDEHMECIAWLTLASEQDDRHAAHALRQAWPKVRDLALAAADMRERAAKAGAEAYAELLRQIQNRYGRVSAEQTGTDTQAYDHIIRRMQDCHGSYHAQIAKAVAAAVRALPIPEGADQRGRTEIPTDTRAATDGDVAASKYRVEHDTSQSSPHQQASRAEQVPTDFKALYFDLLMCVGNKHEGETRHETARRYIEQAERSNNGPEQGRKP